MTRVLKRRQASHLHTRRCDTWTWHWWQRVTSRGRYGLGVDDQAGHVRENSSSRTSCRHARASRAGRIETCDAHTLYTLLFDEMFPGFFAAVLASGVVRRGAQAPRDGDALPIAPARNEFLATAWKE